MADTPAQELREAALSIQVRADCGPGSFWSAVADWLEEVADDRHPSLPSWVEDAALKVARAYTALLSKRKEGP